jgi:hypothetical protein
MFIRGASCTGPCRTAFPRQAPSGERAPLAHTGELVNVPGAGAAQQRMPRVGWPHRREAAKFEAEAGKCGIVDKKHCVSDEVGWAGRRRHGTSKRRGPWMSRHGS